MQQSPIIGVILAGGQSRRFGTAKAFAELAGVSLIGRVIARAAPQVDKLLISAAAADPRLAAFGLSLVMDEVRENGGGRSGPLAGIHAALRWISMHEPRARWLASFTVDTPLLPADMVSRLVRATEAATAEIACCRSAGRLHPLLALWSPRLLAELDATLARGERAAHRFVESRRLAVVDFPTDPIDPFGNVNTPEELARIATLLSDR